ncbi:hypothetical protein BDK51DRAFT_28334 [Blyttiomyces helicus]|uniref:Uncharacterized protein n=1 Tax=Blyttiomyces helicus TaxID=388810 RepID=A0A4P9WCU6_9FUNG|nr:hypothetical protein BDK51DRAFT_28334 [Blyttiomyces helicus]|eukprot:RKO89495.1 hypothetical protein BDK51DRAFT_28334 [Blyttiomyces helicus]
MWITCARERALPRMVSCTQQFRSKAGGEGFGYAEVGNLEGDAVFDGYHHSTIVGYVVAHEAQDISLSPWADLMGRFWPQFATRSVKAKGRAGLRSDRLARADDGSAYSADTGDGLGKDCPLDSHCLNPGARLSTRYVGGVSWLRIDGAWNLQRSLHTGRANGARVTDTVGGSAWLTLVMPSRGKSVLDLTQFNLPATLPADTPPRKDAPPTNPPLKNMVHLSPFGPKAQATSGQKAHGSRCLRLGGKLSTTKTTPTHALLNMWATIDKDAKAYIWNKNTTKPGPRAIPALEYFNLYMVDVNGPAEHHRLDFTQSNSLTHPLQKIKISRVGAVTQDERVFGADKESEVELKDHKHLTSKEDNEDGIFNNEIKGDAIVLDPASQEMNLAALPIALPFLDVYLRPRHPCMTIYLAEALSTSATAPTGGSPTFGTDSYWNQVAMRKTTKAIAVTKRMTKKDKHTTVEDAYTLHPHLKKQKPTDPSTKAINNMIAVPGQGKASLKKSDWAKITSAKASV